MAFAWDELVAPSIIQDELVALGRMNWWRLPIYTCLKTCISLPCHCGIVDNFFTRGATPFCRYAGKGATAQSSLCGLMLSSLLHLKQLVLLVADKENPHQRKSTHRQGDITFHTPGAASAHVAQPRVHP